MFRSLLVKDLRSFHGLTEIPLAPVTLLVGGNSAGKSTVLAAYALAARIAAGQPVDFKAPPYDLGSWEDFAHHHGGQGKRAKEVGIGATFRAGSGIARFEASFTRSPHGQPEQGTIQVAPEGEPEPIALDPAFLALFRFIRSPSEGTPETERIQRAVACMAWARRRAGEVRPSAPIRSQPRRTYNPGQSTPDPEGAHVPVVLANLKLTDPEGWNALRAELHHVGQSTGLFEQIELKRWGRKVSDPFEIQVDTGGRHDPNLIDVGYGVSQALALLVDTFLADKNTVFLLQQPEVHLHPQAQAGFGSFIGRQAKHHGKSFLVETHSDHLVDRIRMDVRDTALTPKDVVILYFEREAGLSIVHPLHLDAGGDFKTEPPASYRRFFLEEQRRFLFGRRE